MSLMKYEQAHEGSPARAFTAPSHTNRVIRLENYLNLGVFLEKYLKFKHALKSTGKS